MEFWITIAGLARRKRVIIPALLIGVVLGTAAYMSTPARYASSTTMVLTTTPFGGSESQDPSKPTDKTNPMLNFSDSLRTTAAILIEAMNTKEVATTLGLRGASTLIVNDGRTNPNLLGLNGPFLYISGESTTPENAQALVQGARTIMRDKLKTWQSALNAPQKTYVSIVDVVPPTAPAAMRGRATKLGLLAFLFGFGLSMGVAYFADRVSSRRRARAAAQPAPNARPLADRPRQDRPREDGPERRRTRRPSPTPVLVPDDDEEAEPAFAPTSLKKIRSRST